MRIPIIYYLPIVVIICCGCEINNVEVEIHDESKIPRLNFYTPIDGVTFGDTISFVEETLGSEHHWSEADVGIGFDYYGGPHIGLNVMFNNSQEVCYFELYSDYKGKTNEGLGISSEREIVLDYLGKPYETGSDKWDGNIEVWDKYKTKSIHLSLQYIDNKLCTIYILNLDYLLGNGPGIQAR